jgi:hypothetical protein
MAVRLRHYASKWFLFVHLKNEEEEQEGQITGCSFFFFLGQRMRGCQGSDRYTETGKE